MKEIVIMVGPDGPDQRLVNMLKQLFPGCTIRFAQAGSNNISPKGDNEPIHAKDQKAKNG